jgi:hypothetical protein
MVASDAIPGIAMKQSTMTAAAAVLFALGIVLTFAALYRHAESGGPLLWAGLAALAGAVVCWFLSANAGETAA